MIKISVWVGGVGVEGVAVVECFCRSVCAFEGVGLFFWFLGRW